MKRNELRQPYPAHSGQWRAAPERPRIQPKREPPTFGRVLGGIVLYGIIILAVVTCVLAAVKGLGVLHHG